MTRKQDIDALIATIQSQFLEIQSEYDKSLHNQEISSQLKIKIKNFFENARSMLDYVAHDICESIGLNKKIIYFPIVSSTDGKINFISSIGRNIPKLEENNIDLYNYIESIQPYNNGMQWLGDFINVTNNLKHQQLTPQTRTETTILQSAHTCGSSVSWNPSAVKFGAGVSINGASVNPITQMPISTPNTTITKQIWVSFLFPNGINSIELIRKVCEDLPKIIYEIYNKM